MNKSRIPKVDEKQVLGLLTKYSCPTSYHEVRTRFLGHIATPAVTTSPIKVLEGLWGGAPPKFESIDELNELIGVLINGLWNSLTRHQKCSEPFQLIRKPIEASRVGLAEHALMRKQEIDGFIYEVFNGQESVDLPQKADDALEFLVDLCGMLSGVHAFAVDMTKLGSDEEWAMTLKKVQQLTPIIENEINAVVLACARARLQTMQDP